MNWYDLFVGASIGFVLVGASTQRTLEIIDSRIVRVALGCAVISLSHYHMVRFATNDDLTGYIGFSLGSGLVSVYQAQRRRDYQDLQAKLKEEEENA